MAVLVISKTEDDPVKNEGARVVIDYSDAQWQLTLKSVIENC